MTTEMEQLCAKRDSMQAKLKTLNVQDNFDEVEKLVNDLADLDKSIDLQEKIEKAAKESLSDTLGAKGSAGKDKDTGKFKTFADQLRAIRMAGASNGKVVDPRLVQNAVDTDAMNTENEEDGGYAIQSDFLGNILERAFKTSEIPNRCRVYNLSRNSNRANWLEVKDEDDATKDGIVVAGGVYAAWVKEAGEIVKSKPAFNTREERIGKIAGAAVVTEEMLEDVPFMANFLEDSFGEAVGGLLTDGILNGNRDTLESASAQPLGIFNSKALVKIPRTSDKLTTADLISMRSGLRTKSWSNAAWFMHSDLQKELPLLNDGNGNLVYMPSGGISGSQYEMLFGKPVIYDDFLPAKGSVGDVLLADFNEYLLMKKGEERKDWSIHVRFLNDERVFRIVLRCGGAPINNRVFSVRHSTSKRGAFVALGEKATAASTK